MMSQNTALKLLQQQRRHLRRLGKNTVQRQRAKKYHSIISQFIALLVDERETYSVDCVFPVLIRVDIGPVLQ